ncbi:hypothetical protein ACODT4_44015 [Streptomyces sp. 2.9]
MHAHDTDEDLVNVDPHDPGDGSLPVFRWRQASPGYTAPPAPHLLAA